MDGIDVTVVDVVAFCVSVEDDTCGPLVVV